MASDASFSYLHMPHFECWARIASDGRAHASALVPIPPAPSPAEKLNAGILTSKPSSYYTNPFVGRRQHGSQRHAANNSPASASSIDHGDVSNVLNRALSHPPLIANTGTATSNPLTRLSSRDWIPPQLLLPNVAGQDAPMPPSMPTADGIPYSSPHHY